MIIRENNKAGNILVLMESNPLKGIGDFREEQADRLMVHKTKKLISAGGLFIKGKKGYFFCKTLNQENPHA
jgi:hypothetical protein